MPRSKAALASDIRSLRQALRLLARSFDRIAPVLAAAGANGSQPRRRRRLTPAQRAALKLQGRYMGTMRGLKPTQKAKVKRIRAQRGIRAAIAAARRLAV